MANLEACRCVLKDLAVSFLDLMLLQTPTHLGANPRSNSWPIPEISRLVVYLPSGLTCTTNTPSEIAAERFLTVKDHSRSNSTSDVSALRVCGAGDHQGPTAGWAAKSEMPYLFPNAGKQFRNMG